MPTRDPRAAGGPGPAAYVRRAFALPPVCPLALVAAAFPGELPSWCWQAPSEDEGRGEGHEDHEDREGHGSGARPPSRSPERLVGLWPVAAGPLVPGPAGAAAADRALAALAATTRSLGRAPPGGWRAWPAVALALPFAAAPGGGAGAPAKVAGPERQPAGVAPPWAAPPGCPSLGPAASLGQWRAFGLLLRAVHDGPRGPQLTGVWLGQLPRHASAAAWARHQAEQVRVVAACRRAARALAAGLAPAAKPTAPLRGSPRAAARAAAGLAAERTAFVGRVARAQQAMAAGTLRKVVLARAARASAPAGHVFDALATWQALAARAPGGYVFFWRLGPDRAFVGASPERLLRLRGRRVLTHAVAGTARTAPAAARLLRSRKDRLEHHYVVAAIEAGLAACCRQLRVAPAPRLLAAGALWHLETPIEGTLAAPATLLGLAAALHPTPALGGTPRGAALAWLARTEPWRGLYGGCVGACSEREGTLAVAIRSALVTPQVAHAFAGAGIVPASEPAAEWQETKAKLATLLGGLVVRTATKGGPPR